jgi:hypothetical protein
MKNMSEIFDEVDPVRQDKIVERTAELVQQYDQGFLHEVLHTSHVLLDTWERHVDETAACEKFPDLKVAANRALIAMNDFYQLAGSKME